MERNPEKTDELSKLIQTSTQNTDDRTSAIEPAKLKQAQQEAKKVERKIESRQKYLLLAKTISVCSIFGIIFYFDFINNFKYFNAFLYSINDFKSRIFFTIPNLADISPQELEILRKSASTSLSESGPTAEIVQVPESKQFYIATNLPDGVVLNFYLIGIPGEILNEKQVKIRFPITVTKHLAKTPTLELNHQVSLPTGKYDIYIDEDDEQLPEIQALLSRFSSSKTHPSFISNPKKLMQNRKFLMGEQNELDFLSKQKEFISRLHERGLAELQNLDQLAKVTEIRGQALSEATTSVLSQSNRKTALKLWSSFLKQSTPAAISPLPLASPVASEVSPQASPGPSPGPSSTASKASLFYTPISQLLQTLSQEIETLNHLMTEQWATSKDPAVLLPSLQEKLISIHSKQLEVRQKLDTELKHYENLSYFPNLPAD